MGKAMTFKPLLNPYEMLELGIFDGKYYLPTNKDFDRTPTINEKNLFAKNVSLPLSEWQTRGWITPEDPMGWFQWYLRYYQGRRIPELDEHQIKRHNSFCARHGSQIANNGNGDISKRIRQRQSVLHWGGDPIPDIMLTRDEKITFLKNLLPNEINLFTFG